MSSGKKKYRRHGSGSSLKFPFLFRCRVRQTVRLDSEKQKQRCMCVVTLLVSLAWKVHELARVPAGGGRKRALVGLIRMH